MDGTPLFVEVGLVFDWGDGGFYFQHFNWGGMEGCTD